MLRTTKTFAIANAIQVKIDNNIRMLAELHASWEREDKIASQPPIFPTRTRSPKGRKRGATTPPHHLVARPDLPARGDMVWGPRAALTIVLKPIYIPLAQKP